MCLVVARVVGGDCNPSLVPLRHQLLLTVGRKAILLKVSSGATSKLGSDVKSPHCSPTLQTSKKYSPRPTAGVKEGIRRPNPQEIQGYGGQGWLQRPSEVERPLPEFVLEDR
eukprot:CAMPEP_0184295172 /NCGR_PEP_ID=MMETSP1049-20130417/6116_1 /TAXON_ID=77928 /ORGANISM="Proteomonas sulcata, Strain CCMP704" /LENGTH=111 /DNA_ID=CAMNT_0026603623 /DNA_START=439 /DNA_END=772 /DNA_ORIENTATION=+